MTKNYNTQKKYRQIEFIIYSEHYADEFDLWAELDDLRCRALLSPLHDKDVFEKGENKGKFKKPHWHLLCFFSSTKSVNQIRELCFRLTGSTNLYKEIISVGGATAYLTHKHSPNKAQYSEMEIKSFGGADYQALLQEQESKFSMLIKIIQYNNIKNFKELINFLITSEFEYLVDEAGKRCFALSKLF